MADMADERQYRHFKEPAREYIVNCTTPEHAEAVHDELCRLYAEFVDVRQLDYAPKRVIVSYHGEDGVPQEATRKAMSDAVSRMDDGATVRAAAPRKTLKDIVQKSA
jgi:hypothetical protein